MYFPCSITFALWVILVIFSRCNYVNTQTVTALAAGLALVLWFSWMVLTFGAYSTDSSLSTSAKQIVLGVGLAGILCSLGLGIGFNIGLRRGFGLDAGFVHWRERTEFNTYTYRVLSFLSLLSMPIFRLLYSRFFNLPNFSGFFLSGVEMLLLTNRFTFLYIFFSLLPFVFNCGFLIYIKQSYDQSLIYAIDTLILSLFLLLFLVIDVVGKGEKFF